MTRFAIDAPTLVHLLETGIRPRPEHQVVAPNLIRSQVLALLLDAVRAGGLSDADAAKQLELLAEFKARLLGDRVSRRTAFTLAREHDWDTTFDAEYLAVARLQADALVTVDPMMAKRAAGIVPVLPLEALTRD